MSIVFLVDENPNVARLAWAIACVSFTPPDNGIMPTTPMGCGAAPIVIAAPCRRPSHHMLYFQKRPILVPSDLLLVHNQVRPRKNMTNCTIGENGFRVWFQPATAKNAKRLEKCDCGWAPRLGKHYRVRMGRSRSRAPKRKRGTNLSVEAG